MVTISCPRTRNSTVTFMLARGYLHASTCNGYCSDASVMSGSVVVVVGDRFPDWRVSASWTSPPDTWTSLGAKWKEKEREKETKKTEHNEVEVSFVLVLQSYGGGFYDGGCVYAMKVD